jgi:serine-threonine kinase receptor-associated protein
MPLVCHGHTRPIVELEYTPVTPDGYFLASASKDGQPMLRNGETGDWIGTFQGHKGAVWSCKLNNPGMLGVTGSADFSARLWDALTGDEKCVWHHKHIVRTVDFANDCHRVVTGGHEKLLRIFDAERPEAAPQEFPQAGGPIRCVKWTKSDDVLLTSDLDKPGITMWDVRQGKAVRQVETAGVVTSIEVSQDGRHVTTADGQHVRIWDGAGMEPIKSFKTPYTVESASYCAERKRWAAGGNDMWVHLYDYDTGDELDVNKGHHGPVHCVRFAPGGATYASGSEDGTIRIWQTDFHTRGADGPAPSAAGPAGPPTVDGPQQQQQAQQQPRANGRPSQSQLPKQVAAAPPQRAPDLSNDFPALG